MNTLTQEQQEQAMQIAQFVISSGRVLSTDGNTEPASLEVEVSFEASERGFDNTTAAAMGKYAAQNL